MDPGLCATCTHAAIVRSDRGSLFWRCELSLANPDFPKYPRLPVVRCAGFVPKPPASSVPDASQ